MSDQLSYQDKQMINYASLTKKLTNNESVHIVCQGDSMTYGHDTMSSDIRPKKSDLTCEKLAEYPDHEQAGKTYPEALQEFCNTMYGKGEISITNRGYSGDWAEMSRKRWIKNPNADLHLLMLGTNDATNPYIPIDVQQNIEKYVKDMCLLVEQILDFQSAIILLTPPKHSKDDNLMVVNYRQVLKLVGKKYNIPVIDTTEYLKGNPFNEIQSDEVHYNTKGYTIFAAKIGALIANISHIYNPMKIEANEMIIPSFSEYGIAFKRSNTQRVTLNEHKEAPYGIGSSHSKGLMFHLYSKTSFTISFYANSDSLVVVPLFEILDTQGSLNLKMDFGINVENYSTLNQIKSNLTFSGISRKANVDHDKSSEILSNSFLLPTKGYYSITVKNTSSSNGVYLYGFLVRNYFSIIE